MNSESGYTVIQKVTIDQLMLNDETFDLNKSKLDASIVGSQVKILYDEDETFYDATLVRYNSKYKTHTIRWADDEEDMHLGNEIVQILPRNDGGRRK